MFYDFQGGNGQEALKLYAEVVVETEASRN